MKFSCNKTVLMEGISIASKAVSSKTTLPILEGLYIKADQKLTLTGNDLEIGIECSVEADVLVPGEIVLDAKMFGEIVRRMPDSDIWVESNEQGSVRIECEHSRFEIKGLPAAGFPRIPVIAEDQHFEIQEKVLKDMIRATSFAIGTDENRLILTGSLFACKGNRLTVVAIDGFRLALRRVDVTQASNDFSVVVPGKTLSEIGKILQASDEPALVYATSNQMMIRTGSCTLVSRLLEGEYLNYDSLIPREFGTEILVDTKQLQASVERASLISFEEKKYPVKFSLNHDRMVISSVTERGAVREEILTEVKGKPLDIGFNPRFFIDALRAVENDVSCIQYTTSVGPCVIRPVEGDQYIYLIVPVRIKE